MYQLFGFATINPTNSDISNGVLGVMSGYTLLVIAFPILIVVALLVIMFTLSSLSDKLSKVVDRLDTLNENTLRGPMTKEEYDKYTNERDADEVNEKAASNRLAVIILSAALGIIILVFSLIMINVAQ